MNITEKIQLAIEHYDAGNLQQAECFLREIVKEQPENAAVLHLLGIVYAQLGDFDVSVHHLLISLKVNPQNADAYLALGHAYASKGQLDEANNCFQKALQINPSLHAFINAETTVQSGLEGFLKEAKGVIHVGANLGQERDLYASFGLNVVWIEPIPEVFAKLQSLIAPYPLQKAFCYLVTDVDDKEYQFHISNNEGQSSSIYDFAGHKEIWPTVMYTKTITLKSISLSSLVKKEHLDITHYDALVLDTQGSELLVLKGAITLLPHIKCIKTEVADFESYTGCCQLKDLDAFLGAHNFHRIAERRFAYKEGTGSYYDVLYAS